MDINTPMKVLYKHPVRGYSTFVPACPNCNLDCSEYVVINDVAHCKNCGQIIVFDEE